MCQEVPNGNFPRDERIVEPEIRQVVRDGIVPIELAFVDEHADGSRCHRFGRGPDGKERVLVDLRRTTELADTVAFSEEDLSVLDHSHCETRNFPLRHGQLHIGVKICERLARCARCK